jgi:hypothetical protein
MLFREVCRRSVTFRSAVVLVNDWPSDGGLKLGHRCYRRFIYLVYFKEQSGRIVRHRKSSSAPVTKRQLRSPNNSSTVTILKCGNCLGSWRRFPAPRLTLRRDFLSVGDTGISAATHEIGGLKTAIFQECLKTVAALI